jgi:putative protease
LINGREKLTLRFDCKACEMHVVGKIKPGVAALTRQELRSARDGAPLKFFKTRPAVVSSSEFGH